MKAVSGLQSQRRQTGAVSLFVVIFAMLLMSVVTISFIRIMAKDQNQATGNDLAQSAYDSAQAGVEDAKRALVWYIEQCKISSSACSAATTAITSTQCNAAIRSANGLPATQGEIKVQQSTSVDETGQSVDSALDQAYTCVKLQLDTDDYVASVPVNDSVFVPLISTGTFNSVTIQWFSADDLSSPTAQAQPDTSAATPKALLAQTSWPTNRPAVLRTQFMQVGSSFKLSDFDATVSGKSNANTVFLYPTTTGLASAELIARDVRATPTAEAEPAASGSVPLPTRCTATIPSGGYACSMQLTLPAPVSASDRSTATSFLRLTAMYKASHVRITLGDGARFKGVQPVVDSTGRASTSFRRVESRVDLYDTATFPYPDAAVETNGSFCKDFGVTNTSYISGSCNP